MGERKTVVLKLVAIALVLQSEEFVAFLYPQPVNVKKKTARAGEL